MTQRKIARYVSKVTLPLDQELNPALPEEEEQVLITQINQNVYNVVVIIFIIIISSIIIIIDISWWI